MGSKELIQSYLHAKAWSLSAAVWKIYEGGGGGVRITPPPLLG